MRLAGLLVLVVAACGDNTPRDVPFDATSGTRLRVERYLFDDGTSLPSPDGYFDADLHVRCTPQTWIDGVTRCVPDAEDALFSDASCTTAIGRGMLITKPRVFVRHDVAMGSLRPAAIYRAGDPIAAPGQYFQRVDDMCTGPFFTPSEDVYYALGSEESPPIELADSMIGDRRLALRVRTSTDGAVVPTAFFDQQLATDCEPSPLGVCEPLGAPTASYFADAACTQPAVAAFAMAAVPLVARVEHGADCATYHTVGPELTDIIYRLDGDACVAASRAPLGRYFALGEEAALAPVERTPENAHRRLQRVRVAADGIVSYSHELVDTAIDAECARAVVGDAERCMPTSTLAALDLYAVGCAQQVRVTAVPIRSCQPAAFAVTVTDHAELHAIGEVTSQTVYRTASDGTCKPFLPPPGQELRTLGPALPDDTFLAVHSYGER